MSKKVNFEEMENFNDINNFENNDNVHEIVPKKDSLLNNSDTKYFSED
jgi:hypothetical protein